jgi:hypothetical protein
MNDIFELWSLPWHTLQRNLAETFGSQASAIAATQATRNSGFSSNSGNWLQRAGTAVPTPQR